MARRTQSLATLQKIYHIICPSIFFCTCNTIGTLFWSNVFTASAESLGSRLLEFLCLLHASMITLPFHPLKAMDAPKSSSYCLACQSCSYILVILLRLGSSNNIGVYCSIRFSFGLFPSTISQVCNAISLFGHADPRPLDHSSSCYHFRRRSSASFVISLFHFPCMHQSCFSICCHRLIRL